MRLLGRTKSPSPDSKVSTNARASSPPERRPPPKLRLKEPESHRPKSPLSRWLSLSGHQEVPYVFSDEDAAEFEEYREQNRKLEEQRRRTESHPALATMTQSTQGGGDSADDDERSYSSPPVRRTSALCELALDPLCYMFAEDYPPVLMRSVRRKDGPGAGISRPPDPRLAPCARIEDVGQDEDAQDVADSSDGENSFETAAEGDIPGDDPTIGGAGHRADEQRRGR